jgi:hypothetical protein
MILGSHRIRASAAALALCFAVACAAPIVPQRSKPGGSARWAEALAQTKATLWTPDAQLCRISGAGIGVDGWLPDRGGTWQLDYFSASKPKMLEVNIDSDGGVTTREVPDIPQRGHALPAGWADSPKAWAATRTHQKIEPLHTFDAELGFGADAEHAKDQVSWRIRFWQTDNTYATHVVSAEGAWLASY